jgi:hypothetical protein
VNEFSLLAVTITAPAAAAAAPAAVAHAHNDWSFSGIDSNAPRVARGPKDAMSNGVLSHCSTLLPANKWTAGGCQRLPVRAPIMQRAAHGTETNKALQVSSGDLSFSDPASVSSLAWKAAAGAHHYRCPATAQLGGCQTFTGAIYQHHLAIGWCKSCLLQAYRPVQISLSGVLPSPLGSTESNNQL